MNISKPTKFKHNIHVHVKLDPDTGKHVLEYDEPETSDENSMTISRPTEFKHNLHAKVDPDTNQIILCSPTEDSFMSSRDENSYECNNCREIYMQWKRDQVKIKELQEENHSMLAKSARLCCIASEIYNTAWDQNTFRCSTNSKNLREFEENMALIANSLATIRNKYLQSEDENGKLDQKIKDMGDEIILLNYKLKEARNHMTTIKREFDRRAERAEKELNMLKPHFIELQNENDRLRCKLHDLKIWLTEWHSSSTKISSSLHEDMSYRELRKENELLKNELRHVENEKNRLNEEQSSTMEQILKNAEKYPKSQTRGCEGPDPDDNQPTGLAAYSINEHCSGKNITSGKHVNYNINAKAVNIIEKYRFEENEQGENVRHIEETIL